MNFLTAHGQPGGRDRRGRHRGRQSRSGHALEPGTVAAVRACGPSISTRRDGIGLEANVDFVEMLGSTSYVHATLATGETVIAERRAAQPRAGDKIMLRFAPTSVRLFGEDGARIR